MRTWALWVLAFVTIILLGGGAYFVHSAYDVDMWKNNPPFDPSVFGAGISVMAVGLAFLFALTGMRREK
jgi:hypothetical protein